MSAINNNGGGFFVTYAKIKYNIIKINCNNFRATYFHTLHLIT